MNRHLILQARFGSVGLCLALASACSHQASSSFPVDGDDSGTSGLNGSSSGGAPSSSGGSEPETNDGDAASGTATPATGTPSGSPGASSDTDSGAVVATAPSGDAAASCDATMAAGAITLSANFLEPKVFGDGGYAYSYSDAAKGGTSTVCLDTLALCGAGTTGAMSTATWGAGIGVNLNQAMGVSPPMGMFAATGSGISYT